VRGETNLRAEIEKNGFAIREAVLSIGEVERLKADIDGIDQAESVRKRGGIFAIRNLLDASAEVRQLAGGASIQNLVEPVLGPDSIPVRAILFDKIPAANWKVPWHQDVTIAVQEKVEADGFGPWSIKADVLHVQPPAFVLERMISVRIHLDPCGETNGALKVIPSSHLEGRIPEDRIEAIRARIPARVCAVETGDALLMRPLLLHASSSSQVASHRRVVHIDFAAVELPNGMKWLSERA
jgi:ectoine hydroxylase-related dioxygenase (phytanoyl-CoA dioxygenase family)